MVDYSCDTCINQYTNKCNHCIVTEYHGQMVSVPTNYKRKPCPCEDAISREDALKLIYDFKEKHTEDREKHPINYGTLLDLIRLIRELPPVRPQEPCDDVISRNAVEDALYEYSENNDANYNLIITEYIDTIPSVTQKSKTGHWIKKEDDTCWWYVCSECGQEPLKNRWNDDDVLSRFCPYCGAKAESEEQTE